MDVSRLGLVTVALLFSTIVLGGYVSQIGAGMACPDWPLCPLTLDHFVVAEFAHRIVAFASFLSALTMFITVAGNRGSTPPRIRKLVSAGFTLLIVQVFLLGSSVIYTALQPLLVTAHLGVAVSVFTLYAMAYYSLEMINREK
ncbi:Heme A synthase [archaeon HR01]|nr:Heme A synthase [archaeon HR01]